MSYILDALRKSEEERTKSGAKPTRSGITFIKDTPPTKKNKFAFGLILTSFMMVSGVILGAGWWWAQKEQAASGGSSTTAPPIETAVETTTEAPAEIPSVALPTESSPTTSDSRLPSQPLEPLVQPADEIPYLEDMGKEFQQRIPKLKFSGHVYSPEPELRMIMINDVVVREGDPIETGLVLNEINTDGVVIRLNQTRFQIKLF